VDFSVLTINLKIKNVSDKSRKNLNVLFPENLVFYEIMWKKYSRVREATDDNITQRWVLHAG
jgi:hypothetical protein